MRRHRDGLDDTHWAELIGHGYTEYRIPKNSKKDKVPYTRLSKVSNISRAEFHDIAQLSDARDSTKETDGHGAEVSLEKSNNGKRTERKNIAVTAWEEWVTIHRSLRDGVTSIIILTDPLPKVRQRTLGQDKPCVEWLPFTEVCPRGRPTATPDGTLEHIGTFRQAKDLKQYLNGTNSSGPDILSWVSTDSGDEEANRQWNDAYLQAEKIYNSLRTEMSLIDSRRGIAEAKGVSKLTELAFVFVPITFAASVFSMQVKELQAAPPLYAFIIAALLCVTVSYAIRTSTRSDILLDAKRRLFDDVRRRYDIRPNRPVSTRKVLAYALSLISDIVFYVVFFVVVCVGSVWVGFRDSALDV
ncbi:hypothetical protein BDV97DRAFT_400350 [Delphinella strobiligena]|nr:hypothetical protein BDV97DRAFT_400350 [Delphinella strobiligena]